ncbi:uncharacterized protein F5147DRAFT_607973 [Suillus discolor]|uniref:Uncharacterized protein n=1 Tax=Suillus discolor TaxID=1912936 RepID=A0A9P7JXF0_9AGAM|nr:uncharacterized protein F5147DRAFT_607973 [Suillus discolor]KAG2113426.1 hypothetical protein F5147DRAFT_607973 [Suillus discolor]
MSFLIITAADVSRIVSSIHHSRLENLMAFVFHTLSSGSGFDAPLREAITMAQHNALFMPARVQGLGTSIKVVSIPRHPVDQGGLPASSLVLDETTGGIRAIVNARQLTALRTAAGSLLATRLLLSVRDPTTLLAFGAGKQIEAHVDLHLRAYSTIKTCTIVNKSNNQRLTDLIIRLKSAHPTVTFQSLILRDDLARLEQVTRAANIICTATSSKEPLFEAEWVSPGTHLNLIGSYTPEMAEVSSELLHQAGKVVVDSREACASEAGELIKAKFNEEDMVEIGTLVHFDNDSPDADYKKVHALCDEVRQAGKITIFKSVGVGLQDVAITNMVVNLAGEIGTLFSSYD